MRRPTVEMRARAGIRTPRAADAPPPTAADYIVGPALDAAERAGEAIEIVWPIVAADLQSSKGKSTAPRKPDGVQNWAALEAVLHHVLYTALRLPARPLGYYVAVGLPPGLPLDTYELLTQLLFEQLHVPALLLCERPLLALYACGVMSGVVVDIGRTTTDVSVVHDGKVYGGGMIRCGVGEDDLDTYTCAMLLRAQPTLPTALSRDGTPLAGPQLRIAMRRIVDALKAGGHISFASLEVGLNVRDGYGNRAVDTVDPDSDHEQDSAEITDVAAALASGKVKRLFGKGGDVKRKKFARCNDPADVVQIAHPLDPTLPPVGIGPERHRYAEPLFDPWVLARASYPLTELERRAMSVTQAMAKATGVVDATARPTVWSNFVVTSRGPLTRMRGIISAMHTTAIYRVLPITAAGKSAASSQPSIARIVRTPEYLSEFTGRRDLVGFAGLSIVAKITFNDTSAQHFVTKADYAAAGPSLVRVLHRAS